jgi:translation initiation factor 2B subunit (eIF-2B alpha/beta/delta family)
LATFEGLKVFASGYQGSDPKQFLLDLDSEGKRLAWARPNEPLAKNGLKYVSTMIRLKNSAGSDVVSLRELVGKFCDEYLWMIKVGKDRIVESSNEIANGIDEVLTHCHSSTAERVLKNLASKTDRRFKVVCTETRPMLQGRITAANLVKMGLDTTLIADSAAESYVIDKGQFPVDVVFLGADEITIHGDAINKIGSWGIALAAYYANKPVYIITSILKVDPSTAYEPVKIEVREDKELWDNPPSGLKMYNPAFELINHEFITGYITEFGVIKPEDMIKTLRNNYEWVF